ncbi:MAG TPA: hypothetical protein EYN07_12190 [Flavobacteriaceae bacterium]|jgi:type VI protein secretion system component VasK|nr:hypothetical protein [Flavobacteriaceae bacterium]MAY53211.1 hypothetical protein [Flavobacteriaceae bacterium]HBR52666.1 hypothetical protein [Flavobacteriaceae bacterium]HIB48172.1 hypothetical protein [Flavobacteriaceae bacterium]HIN99985.1 hypothetical protein [Flavobacteriaceae bacterium]|tara:strand:- start:481 stop:681 length:201 start_codon:yes stop_codon:yes gene_type:complete
MQLTFLLFTQVPLLNIGLQTSATSKMTTGLSIALIVLLALVCYLAWKNQSMQKENAALRKQLHNQK